MKIAFLTTDNREAFRDYSNPVPWFGTAPEAVMQGFKDIKDIEVHVVSCTKLPMKSPEKLADNIWFHSLIVPKWGWLRTGYQGCIRATVRKLKEIRPDLVHGQGTERDSSISAVLSPFPTVVTIHGNMAELARMFGARIGSYGWITAHLENFTLGRTSGVFCNSEYTENLVKPRAKKTWRVPNPIRDAFFSRPKPAKTSAKCILINVGVVCERKRQVELLDMAKRLHAQGLSFELHFLGRADHGSDYCTTFFSKLKEAETAGYAKYLGEKTTAELLECFDAAHGVIHFPTEEAFGLVVPEAMARDLKFFGTRLGGIKDICTGIPGAELYDVNDWDGLTAGIARWINSGSPQIPEAAAIIRERYHPTVIARRHVEIYREVIEKTRGS
jgi:glycosyltransferase involved in cell wall biosynthesis